MSDPVSNVEDVEDVLSSIRRLVSETSDGARPAAADAEDAVVEAPQDVPTPANDALILTSALRIKEPEVAGPVVAEPEVAEPEVVATELESLRKAVSGAFDAPPADAEPEADDGVQPGGPAEEETPVAKADNIARWPSTTPPDDYYEDEPDAVTDAIPFSTEATSEIWELEEDEISFVTNRDVAEAPVEEPWINVDGFEVADDAADVADDAADVADDAADVAEEKSDLAVEMAEALSEEKEDIAASDDQLEVQDDHVAEEAHEDAVSVDGTSIAEMSDDAPAMATFIRAGSEEHADDHEDEAAEAEHTEAEAVVEDAAAEETMFAAEDEDEDQEPIDLGDLEEAVLDEDMLRDLVAEIVRQELTGAMGERITRNVRKLVRREIHRAMASREFD